MVFSRPLDKIDVLCYNEYMDKEEIKRITSNSFVFKFAFSTVSAIMVVFLVILILGLKF